MAEAREAVTKDLPTPPLPLTTPITFFTEEYSFNFSKKLYNVPVYIAAPTSTIDMNTPTGAEIKIEQRKPEEVTEMWYKERMAPEGVKVFNPAFDVTDHELIAGIVTDYAIARQP